MDKKLNQFDDRAVRIIKRAVQQARFSMQSRPKRARRHRGRGGGGGGGGTNFEVYDFVHFTYDEHEESVSVPPSIDDEENTISLSGWNSSLFPCWLFHSPAGNASLVDRIKTTQFADAHDHDHDHPLGNAVRIYRYNFESYLIPANSVVFGQCYRGLNGDWELLGSLSCHPYPRIAET